MTWDGKLLKNIRAGAYQADKDGKLTKVAEENVIDAPYISQIDGIYAWVGCEPTAALAGLKAKGFAKDISLRYFLDNVPRTTSNPEKGFVGDPYT
ncbi:MAG: C39 family peptidase, partial [Bacteroidales bacterium]|nr:C39 family peptidase [Bacteroidales bacterium]